MPSAEDIFKEWQKEVADGNTQLSYEEWLITSAYDIVSQIDKD